MQNRPALFPFFFRQTLRRRQSPAGAPAQAHHAPHSRLFHLRPRHLPTRTCHAPQGAFLPRIPRPPQTLATGNTRRSSPHAPQPPFHLRPGHLPTRTCHAPQGPFLPRIPRPPQPLATGNTRRSSPRTPQRPFHLRPGPTTHRATTRPRKGPFCPEYRAPRRHSPPETPAEAHHAHHRRLFTSGPDTYPHPTAASHQQASHAHTTAAAPHCPAAVRSSSRPRRQAAPAPAIRESSPIVECHRGTAFPKLVSFNFLILFFPEPPAPTRLAADHLMRPHLQKESLYPPGAGCYFATPGGVCGVYGVFFP